jgi:poly(3-hydroxybutyrate) depolymerase
LLLLVLTVLDLAAAKTAGCGKANTMKSGKYSLTVNNKQRDYILQLPESYNKDNPYRLIFGWHWLAGSMNDVAQGRMIAGPHYGLQALANNTVIFVAPNGQNLGFINGGDEDVKFADAILKTIEADLCIDEKQRYSNGFSFGAAMSYTLASKRPKVWRAVAVLSGGIMSNPGTPKEAVAYLGVDGNNDEVIGKAGYNVRDTMVKTNGCKGMASIPEVPKGSKSHVKTVFQGCTKPTVWISFDGGHNPMPKDSGARTTFIPQETWNFFKQFF